MCLTLYINDFMFKFLYDVLIYITNNYSDMPKSFRSQFSEERCVNARVGISDIVTNDEDFSDYE